MNILLMSPFMSYKDRWGQYYKGAGDTFPVGIGSIAGYVRERGYDVDIAEPDIQGWDESELRRRLKDGAYDIIGVSAFTTNIWHAYETAVLIKEVLPQCLVVVGGAHPTLFPKRTLEECPQIDFCIIKEGEVPFLELIRAIEGDTPVSQVPNLYYREGGRLLRSEAQCLHLDLDELPLFPYDNFDLSRYVPPPSLRTVLPTFNYMAQRGCPHSCSFCDTRTHGSRVRYRSVTKVLADLQTLKQTYGLKGLIFEGSNFTARWSWVEALAQGMIELQLNLKWYCMGRVDFNLDLLPLLKRSGLWAMSFGIETGNDATLRRMNKRITTTQAKTTIAAVKKHGIRAIGSFILGYPGEDEADVLNTINYACDLNLDVAVFFIPVPFPGTKLMDDALELGGLRPNLRWQDYSAWLNHNDPIYVNPNLGDKHVTYYNQAFRKFYLRPGYMLGQLASAGTPQGAARLFQGFKSVYQLIARGLLGK